jgi:hypothetical protein
LATKSAIVASSSTISARIDRNECTSGGWER